MTPEAKQIYQGDTAYWAISLRPALYIPAGQTSDQAAESRKSCVGDSNLATCFGEGIAEQYPRDLAQPRAVDHWYLSPTDSVGYLSGFELAVSSPGIMTGKYGREGIFGVVEPVEFSLAAAGFLPGMNLVLVGTSIAFDSPKMGCIGSGLQGRCGVALWAEVSARLASEDLNGLEGGTPHREGDGSSLSSSSRSGVYYEFIIQYPTIQISSATLPLSNTLF
ncbi:hypothetical protein B0H14DRAFT_2615122 [Mycena olivaceomarginata]|nr:hypothetical protein B0H14DRAFT_2615122 [Mycena olivaceomarginata]